MEKKESPEDWTEIILDNVEFDVELSDSVYYIVKPAQPTKLDRYEHYFSSGLAKRVATSAKNLANDRRNDFLERIAGVHDLNSVRHVRSDDR